MKFVGPDEEAREVLYYGNFPASVGADALLMHYKLDDGKYRLFYSVSRTEVVSLSELVKLQGKMINKLAEK